MDIHENLLVVRTRNWSEEVHYEQKRNTSYKKALIRSTINANELNKMLNLCQSNKRYIIKNSLIRSESEYNQDINIKLIKMGNILSKVPHPKKSSYVNYSINPQAQVKKALDKRNNSAYHRSKKLPSSENCIINFQEEIKTILASNHHFAIDNAQNTMFANKKSKLRKLHTIYKYISDTDMKFHYFKDDFNNQQKECKYKSKALEINPEYKFIKMKDDSFYVLNTLRKAIDCIINHFFIAYNNESLFRTEQAINLMEYTTYLKDLYIFYKNEIDEIANNYSILTKGLVNSNKIYANYVSQLCKYCEEQTNEEKLLITTYDQMIKTEAAIHYNLETI